MSSRPSCPIRKRSAVQGPGCQVTERGHLGSRETHQAELLVRALHDGPRRIASADKGDEAVVDRGCGPGRDLLADDATGQRLEPPSAALYLGIGPIPGSGPS